MINIHYYSIFYYGIYSIFLITLHASDIDPKCNMLTKNSQKDNVSRFVNK